MATGAPKFGPPSMPSPLHSLGSTLDDSHGLWVPSQQAAAAWYFIDANRAYRGPITKDTLHFLFSSAAINRHTYVFTENLTPTRQWIRIRKVDWLAVQLSAPLVPARSAPAPRPPSTPDTERRGAKEGDRLQGFLAAGPAAIAPSGPFAKMAAADAEMSQTQTISEVPVPVNSPTVATPRHSHVSMEPANFRPAGAPSAAAGGRSSGAGGAVAARSGPRLSEKLAASYHAAAAPSRASSAGSGKSRRGWFGKGKAGAAASPKPTASRFGQPLDASTPLTSSGVPTTLEQLRMLLLQGEGYRIEGIFRVSPAASALKASRELVEAGRVARVSDLESAAQLIKVWFRELPTSILAGCAAPIVDGELHSPAACDAALQRLPEVNRRTLYWVLELITDICRYEAQNRMTAQSMVIVFAPNLIAPPDTLDPMSALEVNRRVVQFMEMLFKHYNEGGSPAGRIGPSPSMVARGARA